MLHRGVVCLHHGLARCFMHHEWVREWDWCGEVPGSGNAPERIAAGLPAQGNNSFSVLESEHFFDNRILSPQSGTVQYFEANLTIRATLKDEVSQFSPSNRLESKLTMQELHLPQPVDQLASHQCRMFTHDSLHWQSVFDLSVFQRFESLYLDLFSSGCSEETEEAEV